jgi:hypothetical protein
VDPNGNLAMPTERDGDETEYGRWQTTAAKALAEDAPGLDEPGEICPSDALRTAFVSVSNSASVRYSSRLLLPSIRYFLLSSSACKSCEKIIRHQKTP